MDNEVSDKSIKDNVLGAINTGKATMRPKWHFVLQAVLLVLGVFLSVLTGMYLVSFIIFILHQTGIWFLPGLGGVALLFTSLPWVLVLVAIIFIIVLEILVKKYSFGYKKPLLYSSLGVIVLVLAGGFVLAQTSLHRGLFNRARHNSLPIGGSFYRQFGTQQPPSNVAFGVITDKLENGFRITDPSGKIIDIITNDQTEFWTDDELVVSDHIVVVGEHQDLGIQASSIKEIDADDFPLPFEFMEEERNSR